MHDSTSELAIAATGKAHTLIIAARTNLLGRRLPLAGIHRDPGQVLADLRAAQREIEEAIRLVEIWQREEQNTK